VGPEGPEGPEGPQGPPGPQGEPGPIGLDVFDADGSRLGFLAGVDWLDDITDQIYAIITDEGAWLRVNARSGEVYATQLSIIACDERRFVPFTHSPGSVYPGFSSFWYMPPGRPLIIQLERGECNYFTDRFYYDKDLVELFPLYIPIDDEVNDRLARPLYYE
jgi:hypothetical protein